MDEIDWHGEAKNLLDRVIRSLVYPERIARVELTASEVAVLVWARAYHEGLRRVPEVDG